MASPLPHPFASRFRRPGPQISRRKRHFPALPTWSAFPAWSAVAGVAMAVAAFTLSGCVTGSRPSFDDTQPTQTITGNAAIDAVLARLDVVAASTLTADYEILTRLGNIESTATVVQASPERRSITINDVRFIYDGASVATCNLATAECEATINDARVSDLLLSHEFYGSAFAQRIRVDANRRVSEPNGYTITQAELQALCVDIPVTGGTTSYCALESGALARYDGNDLFIEMTTFTDIADEAKFATS